MEYFIKPSFNVDFIFNGKNYIVYDYFSGKIFTITDNLKINIIHDILNMSSESFIKEKYKENWSKFKLELQKENLIRYSNNQNKFKDTIDFGGRFVNIISNNNLNKNLFSLTLDIFNSCNQNCLNCNYENAFPCLSCTVNKKAKKIKELDYENIISKFFVNDIQNIIFRGGDPFLEFDFLKCITKFIKNISPKTNIIIISNCFEIINNPKIIDFIKQNNISINVQIIKDDPKYISILYNLLKSDINFNIVLRCDISNKLSKFIEENNLSPLKNMTIESIIKLEKSIINESNLLSQPSLLSNLASKFTNLCMYKKLSLNFNGDIYVCNGTNDIILGNIENNSFKELYNNADSIYKSSKFENKDCITCNFKKHCNSCSLIRQKYSNYKNLCENKIIYQ